jgi:hypothetical protein
LSVWACPFASLSSFIFLPLYFIFIMEVDDHASDHSASSCATDSSDDSTMRSDSTSTSSSSSSSPAQFDAVKWCLGDFLDDDVLDMLDVGGDPVAEIWKEIFDEESQHVDDYFA